MAVFNAVHLTDLHFGSVPNRTNALQANTIRRKLGSIWQGSQSYPPPRTRGSPNARQLGFMTKALDSRLLAIRSTRSSYPEIWRRQVYRPIWTPHCSISTRPP